MDSGNDTPSDPKKQVGSPERWDAPIAFRREFVRLGGVTTALMLSQAFYWQNRCKRDGGWWWKTKEEWESETGLNRYEQDNARANLERLGILETKLAGMPRKLWFRVNTEAVEEALTSPQKTPVNGIKRGDDWHVSGETTGMSTGRRLTDLSENSPKTSANRRENQNSLFCTTPQQTAEYVPPNPPPVLEFPVKSSESKKTWPLTRQKLAEYRSTYEVPESVLLAELKKARQWLLDNPKRKKTKQGMCRFLTTWLNRANDRNWSGPGTGPNRTAAPPQPSAPYHVRRN